MYAKYIRRFILYLFILYKKYIFTNALGWPISFVDLITMLLLHKTSISTIAICQSYFFSNSIFWRTKNEIEIYSKFETVFLWRHIYISSNIRYGIMSDNLSLTFDRAMTYRVDSLIVGCLTCNRKYSMYIRCESKFNNTSMYNLQKWKKTGNKCGNDYWSW